MTHLPRPMQPDEAQATARIWHDAWHEAHAQHVPEALIRLRDARFFQDRIDTMGDALRVAGPTGAPLGLCSTDGAEIDQLFTAPAARGTGLAQLLIEDGMARIKAAGHDTAHLWVLPENTRAIRFYDKLGWSRHGVKDCALKTDAGPFTLPALLMQKSL
ncbi:MAG: GNAT family N-acetyltransferase [Pseudomonadota bacterium]